MAKKDSKMEPMDPVEAGLTPPVPTGPVEEKAVPAVKSKRKFAVSLPHSVQGVVLEVEGSSDLTLEQWQELARKEYNRLVGIISTVHEHQVLDVAEPSGPDNEAPKHS